VSLLSHHNQIGIKTVCLEQDFFRHHSGQQ
jgi:hypothetical protein